MRCYSEMMSLALTTEAIIAALREARIKQSAVAEALGLPSSAVSNMFNGKREVKLAEANVLLNLLGPREGAREYPLIGMAGAGNWVEAIQDTKATVSLPVDQAVEGEFGVEVVGHSMNRVLPEGSVAIINPRDTELFSNRIYLLLNADGEATIKRYRNDPARFEPDSTDPSYVAFSVGDSDFSVIGRVTGGLSKF